MNVTDVPETDFRFCRALTRAALREQKRQVEIKEAKERMDSLKRKQNVLQSQANGD